MKLRYFLHAAQLNLTRKTNRDGEGARHRQTSRPYPAHLGATEKASGDSARRRCDQFFTNAELKKALSTSSSASISQGMDGEKAMSLRTGNKKGAEDFILKQ